MPAHSPGKLWIGTSNIVLPVVKAAFPEPFRNSSRLGYYATLFSSLEVNSSFYKIPRAATLERWTREVPAGFRFTIKLHKEITHMPDLWYDSRKLEHFMRTISSLGSHKGCLLMQFPPKVKVAYHDKLKKLLEEVCEHDISAQWKKCVEFRDSSWYQPATIQLLNALGISMVIHDKPASACQVVVTSAPFIVIRFHGIMGDYRGSYPAALLASYAERISAWLGEGKDVYAYFNNTMGDAFANAQSLRGLVCNRL